VSSRSLALECNCKAVDFRTLDHNQEQGHRRRVQLQHNRNLAEVRRSQAGVRRSLAVGLRTAVVGSVLAGDTAARIESVEVRSQVLRNRAEVRRSQVVERHNRAVVRRNQAEDNLVVHSPLLRDGGDGLSLFLVRSLCCCCREARTVN